MLPIRDDQPRYSTPYVTYFLIGLNLMIYFFQRMLEMRDPNGLRGLVYEFGVVPSHLSALLHGSTRYSLLEVFLPFFTSMFLHGDWWHVIGNMWFLHIFGDNVEDYLGHFKYLVFYLGTGLIATTAQVLVDTGSTVPTIGASGAIAGILGAYFVLYPRARVLTWFFVFVIWIPAWIILGYWFTFQFFSGTANSLSATGHNMGGIAFWAHVGGFISGLVLIKLFPARSRRSPYAMS